MHFSKLHKKAQHNTNDNTFFGRFVHHARRTRRTSLQHEHMLPELQRAAPAHIAPRLQPSRSSSTLHCLNSKSDVSSSKLTTHGDAPKRLDNVEGRAAINHAACASGGKPAGLGNASVRSSHPALPLLKHQLQKCMARPLNEQPPPQHVPMCNSLPSSRKPSACSMMRAAVYNSQAQMQVDSRTPPAVCAPRKCSVGAVAAAYARNSSATFYVNDHA